MSYVTGVGMTPFGKHPGRTTLDLMSEAATAALADAQLERADVDGLLCAYSTTFPHLMLSTTFVEHFGLSPTYAHSILVGGATGFAMAMLAHTLVQSGVVRNPIQQPARLHIPHERFNSTQALVARSGNGNGHVLQVPIAIENAGVVGSFRDIAPPHDLANTASAGLRSRAL